MKKNQKIGVFDSGFGGLTVFNAILQSLPQYHYIYLGDNARSPYGDHSFDTVYQYTLESVEWLFNQGCRLVILACNTASAKALRNIQQIVLSKKYPNHRVLGVIRPTAEVIGNFTKSNNIGVLGTRGTVASKSYIIEINKFFPALNVYQQSCPMWVPLIENNEHLNGGADYFVQKYLDELLKQNQSIDTILLACTHYPLILPKIRKYLKSEVNILSQGDIVAESLINYLHRHNEIEELIEKNNTTQYYTTGDSEIFDAHASLFMNTKINSKKIKL